MYRKTSNVRCNLVGNKIVDHSDVVRSIACRRCSNYIFILDLTSGFNGFGKDSHKTVQESLNCWDLVQLILETWRYVPLLSLMVDRESVINLGRYQLITCVFENDTVRRIITPARAARSAARRAYNNRVPILRASALDSLALAPPCNTASGL